MISVIIPIYNRRDNLRLVLAALDRQSFKDFEVVVSDDGSTDDPVGVLHEFDTRLNLRYCWQQHKGYRLSKVRNNGARIATGEAYIFVDSDVMLNRYALEHYYNIYLACPSIIIGGRYDWLPPIREYEQGMEVVGIQGVDPRCEDPTFLGWDDTEAGLRTKYALHLYGGNQLIPANVYRILGGYDENMTGHGGEDAEFGMRAEKEGLKALFSEKVIGWHLYHDRDQAKNEEEVAKNIEYLEKKHNIGKFGIVKGREDQLPLVYEEAE